MKTTARRRPPLAEAPHSDGNGRSPHPAAGDAESSAPALQRGLAVLEHLAGLDGGATLSELGAALGLSPASVFRITGVLEEMGYLRREESSRRFSLTRKLLLLARPQQEGRSLVECCLPAMREVLKETGETVQLCTLAEAECVMIEQLPSTQPFKYIVDIGCRPPIHCCAPGKAMLAYLDAPELDRLLKIIQFTAHTTRSITTARAFVAELGTVRQRGYAVDRAEHFEGIHCVAAPVLDRVGHPVAAITIAGPSSRIAVKRFAEFGSIMKKAAQAAATRYFG